MHNTRFLLPHVAGGLGGFNRPALQPVLAQSTALLLMWCLCSTSCAIKFEGKPPNSNWDQSWVLTPQQQEKPQLIHPMGTSQIWIRSPPLPQAQSRVFPPWGLVAPAVSKDQSPPVPDIIYTWDTYILLCQTLYVHGLQIFCWAALRMEMLLETSGSPWDQGIQVTLMSLYCLFTLDF